MPICKTCGTKIEANIKFCMECGTPVPQVKACIKCGYELPLNAKFCFECGANQAGETSSVNTGITMGDRNVIAGDVTGRKESYNVSGTATIIHNENESGKVEKCHICGSLVKRIEGYECSGCGKFTCADCFDAENRVCAECASAGEESKTKQYKEKLKEFISNDGRIDFSERQELLKLQKQLGITGEECEKLEKEIKQEFLGTAEDELTTLEKISMEQIPELFFGEGKTEEAYKLIVPIYRNHKTDEKVLNLYIQILSERNPEEIKKISQTISFDNLQLNLSLIRIALKENDLNKAERILNASEKMWQENVLVKCHKILYLIALYKHLNAEEWLSAAEDIAVNLGEGNSRIENSWIVKVQGLIKQIRNKEVIELSREECKRNELYYYFLKEDIIVSEKEKQLQEKHGMVKVEGRTVVLGSYNDDYPKHSVTLHSFFISKYPVTQKLYKEIMGTNPSLFDSDPARGETQELRPVEMINCYRAIAFCNKLSIKEGLEPCYSVKDAEGNEIDWANLAHSNIPTEENDERRTQWDEAVCDMNKNGYRLPTEAEWEFAERGGDQSAADWNYEYAGSNTIDEVAWYDDNSGSKTHEVGKKKPNRLGLYDMSGNVWEWCWDWYDSVNSSETVTDPTGAASGSYRVGRGGSYNSYNCAVDYRSRVSPCDYYCHYGFRLVRSSSK